MEQDHFKKLENMYLAAPINAFYQPEIKVSSGKTEIKISVDQKYFHAADAVHGSVYFKMMDDAAFFAANSIVEDVFVLTGTFETKFLRPVTEGSLIAVGELTKNMGNKLEARAKLYNDEMEIVGSGSGIFVKSKMRLDELDSYN